MVDTTAVPAAVQRHSVFQFGDHDIRVASKDGEPWFVAHDVCAALEIANVSDALGKLDMDEKMTLSSSDGHSMGVGLTDSHSGRRGGARALSLVSESGMYTLVLRCRDAVKEGTVPYRFRRWVTGEVLPAIRKTGEYVAQPYITAPTDTLTGEQQEVLRRIVKTAAERLPKSQQGPAAIKMWSKLKAHFGVPYRQIPSSEFTEAVSLLTRATTEWAAQLPAPIPPRQLQAIQALNQSIVDRLPEEKRGAAVVRIAAAAKERFGVLFSELREDQFVDAVELVSAVAAEWDVVDDESPQDALWKLLMDHDFRVHLDHAGRLTLTRVDPGELTIRPERLAKLIGDPGSAITRKLLPGIVSAAAGRLAEMS